MIVRLAVHQPLASLTSGRASANSARSASDCAPDAGTGPKASLSSVNRIGDAARSTSPPGVSMDTRRSSGCADNSATEFSSP